MIYKLGNRDKKYQTATPDKYPQGYFKDKKCRECGTVFSPIAPSEHYCSDGCKDIGAANAYLKRNYGIILSDYNRMFEEQNGLCKICLKKGFKLKPTQKVLLVVDHCHKTGAVRGLLCHNCNRALGLLKDNVDTLNRCIDYLQE